MVPSNPCPSSQNSFGTVNAMYLCLKLFRKSDAARQLTMDILFLFDGGHEDLLGRLIFQLNVRTSPVPV